MGSFARDRRGVSEIVGYLLSVAILAMVVVGLIGSATTYFDQRHRVSVGSGLERQGQQLSRTVGIVDRLARQSDSDGEIGRVADLPEQIGDERYSVTVVNRSRARKEDSRCDRPCLVLSTDETVRTVYLAPVTRLRGGTAVGGSLYVVREADSGVIRLVGRD